MSEQSSIDQAWEDDIVHGLTALATDDVPSLEITLLDAVADWLLSPGNPGEGYGEGHAGHLVSTLFSAIESARGFLPDQQPPATAEITETRARLVRGAHELAAQGSAGVSLLVSRLMPAVLAELSDNAGARGEQARGVFAYLLYAVSIGAGDDQDRATLDGLFAIFAGWDAVLRNGYVVPWRPPA